MCRDLPQSRRLRKNVLERETADQLPQRETGLEVRGLVNFARTVGRDMIAFINKTVDTERLSLMANAPPPASLTIWLT